MQAMINSVFKYISGFMIPYSAVVTYSSYLFMHFAVSTRQLYHVLGKKCVQVGSYYIYYILID